MFIHVIHDIFNKASVGAIGIFGGSDTTPSYSNSNWSDCPLF